jgi:hypothetical protein
MKSVVVIGGWLCSFHVIPSIASVTELSVGGAGRSVLQLHLVACRGFEAEAQGGFKPNARLRGPVERECVNAASLLYSLLCLLHLRS